ncbi:GMC oxidoreductase-domain-containing protein [Flagelloscypha sp. PMI_526]|nr:GMC oxidoreductase-domain-containing protein [Flagelloscypha sp. PMI_526]
MFWSSGFPNSPLANAATPVSAKNQAPSSPATYDFIIVGARCSLYIKPKVLVVPHTSLAACGRGPLLLSSKHGNEFGVKDWTWEKALPLLSKCETVLSRTLHSDGPTHLSIAPDLPYKPIQYTLAAAQNLNIPQAARSNITIQHHKHHDGRIFVAGVFLEAKKPGTRFYYVAATEEVLCSGDLPVGEILQNHANVSVVWTCPKTDSVNASLGNQLLLIGGLFKHLVWGTGLFMIPGPQPIKTGMLKEKVGDSADGSKTENIPDIEFLIIPVGTPTPEGKFDAIPNNDGGFAITTSLLRPVSSGRVHITTSSDPRQNPLVDLGSLTSPEDFVVLRKGVRLALRIGEDIKRLGYPLKDWKRPESLNDDDVDAFIKKNAQPGYHLTSSCPMTKVVDEKLKVKRGDKLRVVDAIVFPWCLATHPMAATVMLAERCVGEFL